MRLISKQDVPTKHRKDVMQGQFVCNVRPEKNERHRTCFTVGGDHINCPVEAATTIADMRVAKLLFNSVISTPGARFTTINILNFCMMMPLKQP